MKFRSHKCEECGDIYGCECNKEHPNGHARFNCGKCKPVELREPQGFSIAQRMDIRTAAHKFLQKPNLKPKTRLKGRNSWPESTVGRFQAENEYRAAESSDGPYRRLNEELCEIY